MPRRTLRSERSNRGGSSVVVMQSGGGSSSNFPGSAIDLNFQSGQYFGVTGSPTTFLTTTRASNKTNLFSTSASGFAYSTFSNNIPAITSGSGLSVEEARTNVLLNSTVPGTQTTASLGTGVYTLWVNGSGSATSSAGTATITGAGVATNGTPNIFTVTVAGTVVVTVGGSLNAFQCELGTSGTSFIVTAGATATRAADVVTLTSPPAFGPAYSMFAKATLQQTAATTANPQVLASISDGTNNNRLVIRRQAGAANSVLLLATGGSAVINSGLAGIPSFTSNASHKFAVAVTASDERAAFDGSLDTNVYATALPITPTTFSIGVSGISDNWVNGLIERIAFFPTRISNPVLQNITT